MANESGRNATGAEGGLIMTRIILEQTLATQLHDLGQPAELCDPSGRVLGQFTPAFDPSEWEPVTPGAGEEELARREQSDAWYTFDEVMGRLRNAELP